MSEMMHAWLWQGKPEAADLEYVERSLPVPQGTDVLIANKAVSLNPVDWKSFTWAALGWQPGHVPGVDGAGVVVAAGPDASCAIGSRVAYHQNLQRNGSFASHTVVASHALLPIPDAVSFRDAATVPCPGLTAALALQKVPVAEGRDVLVIGGGGTVGSFLVQLALQRGYRVWTTASQKHHALLLQSGVAGAFDYHDDAWKEHLQQALQGKKLYAAFDPVSEESARSLAPLVGYNGHLVCIQGRLKSPAVPAFSTAISQHEVALGAIHSNGLAQDWSDLHAIWNTLIGGVATGALSTPEVIPFQLDKLREALDAMKTGKQQGKQIADLP